MMLFALTSSFLSFALDYFPYIIVGVMILVFAIIVTVAVHRRKKPREYVSDDIDRTVDALAEEKASQKKPKQESQEQELKAAKPEQEDVPAAEQAKTEQEDVPATEQAKTEQEDVPATEQAKTEQKDVPATEQAKPEQEDVPATEQAKPEQEDAPATEQAKTKQKDVPATKQTKPKQKKSAPASTQEPPTPEKSDSAPTAQGESSEEEHEEIALDTEEKTEDKPERKKAVSYRILYDKETKTWEVRKDNAKRVIRRVKTKKEALEIAGELSQKQDLNLVVHKKDGKFQKKR